MGSATGIKGALNVFKSRKNPVRAKGVWVWAGFLLLATLGRFPEMNSAAKREIAFAANRDPTEWLRTPTLSPWTGRIVAIILIEIAVAIGICLWWYSQSKLHCRRAASLQIVGFILFAVGTVEVDWYVNELLEGVAILNLQIGELSMMGLDRALIGIAAIVIAYFLVFQTRLMNISTRTPN
jgi:hypothetical protein